ncbi:hypothetical protein VXN68_15040 [Acinetobacter schindleri]|uniref:hypothetical protein n=1 Tax=Acinetobacter schindleri TaxID=108981 RepID=UPI00114E9FF2
MNQPIAEVRRLIDAGKRYLAGSCSIQELHGHASQCATFARFMHSHPGIEQVANEWVSVIYRRWNEWGDVAEPLTEQEFRLWLTAQVAVFPEGMPNNALN